MAIAYKKLSYADGNGSLRIMSRSVGKENNLRKREELEKKNRKREKKHGNEFDGVEIMKSRS